ncbi:phospholipase D-like domain-containing protein [Chondromyces apiculatus]|uniref:phospholipase D-like domain-containing protein n=1 Tax=Chondromyces apiculatus TaxID=51 RepID=UPI000694F73E|nr:phospholipase D-like domain-containing protein [Chondromyces apiculatus]
MVGLFARLRARFLALLAPTSVALPTPSALGSGAVSAEKVEEPAELLSLARAQLKRTERRLSEVEVRAENAVERTRRTEQRAKTAEARAVSAADRAKQALQREMEAETRLTAVEARVRQALQREKEIEGRAALAEERARKALQREKGPQEKDGARSRRGEAPRSGRGAESLSRPSPQSKPSPSSRKGELSAQGDAARVRAAEERARAAEERVRGAEQRARVAERRAEEATQQAQEAVGKMARLEGKLGELEVRAGVQGGRRAEAHVAEVAFSPGEACLEMIRSRLEGARRTLDVCVFTITDDRIAEAILDAHRRGVAVRVITDNDKSLDEGSDVGRLARAGIAVRMDRTEYHMHHKFAVFDGRFVLTGSYNWTRSAAKYNEENLVVSGDPRLVTPFAREFEALWAHLDPG